MRRFKNCVHILDILVTLKREKREEQEVNLKKKTCLSRDRTWSGTFTVWGELCSLRHIIFYGCFTEKRNQMKLAIYTTIVKQPINLNGERDGENWTNEPIPCKYMHYTYPPRSTWRGALPIALMILTFFSLSEALLQGGHGWILIWMFKDFPLRFGPSAK